jgi:hypothetical protein
LDEDLSGSAGKTVDEMLYTDHGLVSAHYFFPPGEPVPPAVVEGATELATGRANGRVFVLGEFDLDEEEGVSLQAPFNDAVSALLTAIRAVALDRHQLAAAKGSLYFDLALVPDSGHAGVFLGHAELSELISAGANLLVSAWPGVSWFDARYPSEKAAPQ